MCYGDARAFLSIPPGPLYNVFGHSCRYPPDPPTMCLAAFAGLLAELGGDLFVGLGGFEPLNIIKSQVEFGVQPVGLRRFLGQCCKNAVGLPVGLAPPPSPTVFFAHFHEPSERPSLGRLRLSLQPCCGQNCSHFPVGPTSPSESNHVFQLFFSAPLLNPVSDPCFPFPSEEKARKREGITVER